MGFLRRSPAQRASSSVLMLADAIRVALMSVPVLTITLAHRAGSSRLRTAPGRVSGEQFAPEPNKGRALWSGLIGRKPAKAAERGPIVERLCELHVGEVVPPKATGP